MTEKIRWAYVKDTEFVEVLKDLHIKDLHPTKFGVTCLGDDENGRPILGFRIGFELE